MIVNFESKILKFWSRYQISDISDISMLDQGRDNSHIAEKKAIFDFLRISDNQKFHFRMLYQFVFFIINNLLEITRKKEKTGCHIEKKSENVLISLISDIRYQELNL